MMSSSPNHVNCKKYRQFHREESALTMVTDNRSFLSFVSPNSTTRNERLDLVTPEDTTWEEEVEAPSTMTVTEKAKLFGDVIIIGLKQQLTDKQKTVPTKINKKCQIVEDKWLGSIGSNQSPAWGGTEANNDSSLRKNIDFLQKTDIAYPNTLTNKNANNTIRDSNFRSRGWVLQPKQVERQMTSNTVATKLSVSMLPVASKLPSNQRATSAESSNPHWLPSKKNRRTNHSFEMTKKPITVSCSASSSPKSVLQGAKSSSSVAAKYVEAIKKKQSVSSTLPAEEPNYGSAEQPATLLIEQARLKPVPAKLEKNVSTNTASSQSVLFGTTVVSDGVGSLSLSLSSSSSSWTDEEDLRQQKEDWRDLHKATRNVGEPEHVPSQEKRARTEVEAIQRESHVKKEKKDSPKDKLQHTSNNNPRKTKENISLPEVTKEELDNAWNELCLISKEVQEMRRVYENYRTEQQAYSEEQRKDIKVMIEGVKDLKAYQRETLHRAESYGQLVAKPMNE